MDSNHRPIMLDLTTLKDFVHDGYARNPEYAYICREYAVLRSFNKLVRNALTAHQPYRLEEMRIGRIAKGHANITFNLIDYDFREGMMLFVNAGSIVQINSLTEDFDIEAISVSDETLQFLFNGKVPSYFISGTWKTKLQMSLDENDIFHRMIDLLWTVIHSECKSDEVIHSLLVSILKFFMDVSQRDDTHASAPTSHEKDVFMRFINLVHKYSRSERMLSFYADKMCLSPRYLGSLVREASGTTTKDWIERSVIAEAKVMLKDTDLLTYQIADELNFPNPSFFCKFFKRLTGMTPQEYQRS